MFGLSFSIGKKSDFTDCGEVVGQSVAAVFPLTISELTEEISVSSRDEVLVDVTGERAGS